MDKDSFNQIIKKWPPKGVFANLLEKYLGMNAGLWISVCVWSWIFKNFFENFWIVYKITDERYIEWQRVAQRVIASDNEWQRMTTSGNEWQRATKNDNQWYNEWYNEWQRVITNDSEWYNKWKRIRTSKREWFWFQNEIIYSMYNFNIFSNIDYL